MESTSTEMAETFGRRDCAKHGGLPNCTVRSAVLNRCAMFTQRRRRRSRRVVASDPRVSSPAAAERRSCPLSASASSVAWSAFCGGAGVECACPRRATSAMTTTMSARMPNLISSLVSTCSPRSHESLKQRTRGPRGLADVRNAGSELRWRSAAGGTAAERSNEGTGCEFCG